MNKQEYRIAGYHQIETFQSHIPDLPIPEGLRCMDLLDEIYSRGSLGGYDDDGMEIEGMDRLMPDDIDWLDEPNHELLETIEIIVNKDFVLKEDPNYPNETFKALNSHIVSGINANADKLTNDAKVLILCAGNGEDINRILHDDVGRCGFVDFVGATNFNPRAATNLARSKIQYRVFEKHLHNMDLDDLRDDYDLIICHHGIHHILRNKAGEVAFQGLLERLAPDGRFIGDFVDWLGLNSMQQPTFSPSHGVELKNVIHGKEGGIDGTMIVRVRNTLWKDPILTHERFTRLVDEAGRYTLHILSGHGAFKQRSLSGSYLTPPNSVKSAAIRSESRIMSYFELKRGPSYEYIDYDLPGGNLSWSRRDQVPLHIATMLSFDINKGQPLQSSDVQYLLYGGPLYAEKSDGVAGRAVILQGSAWLMVEGPVPRFYVATPVSMGGRPSLKFQVEVLDEGGPDMEVVINEPVDLGPNAPSSFLGRLQAMGRILSGIPSIGAIFTSKTWTSSWDAVWSAAKDNHWEGVVAMMPSCPPPSRTFTRGARFIKNRYTYDVLRDGKVVEVDRDDGSFIRDRPDKKGPNNEEAIRWARGGVTMKEYDYLLGVQWVEADVIKFLSSKYIKMFLAEEEVFIPGPFLPVLKYHFMALPEEYDRLRKALILKLSGSVVWRDVVDKFKYDKRRGEDGTSDSTYDIDEYLGLASVDEDYGKFD